jgi:tetratricopeptide (TPR) repeat protein
MRRQSFQIKALLTVMLFAMTLGTIDVLADDPSVSRNSPKASHAAAFMMRVPHNPSPAASLNDLGITYENQNRYAEAESTFRRALSILEKTPGLDPEELVLPLNGLGRVCEHKQQYSEAERLFKRSVSIQQNSPIHSHDEMLAISLDFLGELLCKEHKYSEAEAVYKQSLSSREETYGKNSDMVQHCLKQLSEVAMAQKKFKDAESASERILAITETQLGPVLGPFYMQQMKRNITDECVLPLELAFGPGSHFDEKRFTQEVKRKLGEGSTEWCKIPDWLAGLWGKIPPNTRVTEVNGAVWKDPPPSGFYEGPGPYASRRGFVKTKDGWWHYNREFSSDMWDCGSTSDSTLLVYTYYRTHLPVTENDGSVCFRRSTLHFRVQPDKVSHGNGLSIFVPGTVTTVWQEDNDEVFKKFPDDQVAMFSATRIYGWNGKQLSAAPGDPDRQISSGVSWQKKAGPPTRTKEQGFDYMKSLKEFLTKQKMFDELKTVETLN